MNEENKRTVGEIHGTRSKITTFNKMTSVMLMAIMVAGGLTFAVPGMEPIYAEQVNTNDNLRVSAEGQSVNNAIEDTNIIEVVIIDDANNEDGDSSPIVKVDGNTLTLQQSSGAWYGYFASSEIVNTGLIPMDDDDTNDQAAVDALVKNAPITATPLVQLFDLDGEFDVTYEKPGDDQTVTLDLDEADYNIGLDRSNYPQNSYVVVTIDDQALNVDPTGEDNWWFNSGGEPIYSANPDADNINVHAKAQHDKMTAYAEAEKAKTALLADPEGDRDEKVEMAEFAYSTLKAQADVALDDIFISEDRKAEINAAVETARSGMIAITGQGEQTSNDENNADYKGSAQIMYEQLVGVGGKNIPASVSATDPETSNDINNGNFIGTAQYDYLRDIAVADDEYQTVTGTANLPTETVEGIEDFVLDAGDIVICTGMYCGIIDDEIWIKFTEDGDNNNLFMNSQDDKPNLMTSMDAQRGLSFSVEYSDRTSSGSISFYSTDITVEPTTVTPGQQVVITLTDADFNTSTVEENDFDATGSASIPTITVGNPFTLAEAGSVTISGGDYIGKSVNAEATDVGDVLMLSLPALDAGDYSLSINLGDWDDFADAYLPANHDDFLGTHMINYDIEKIGGTSISLMLGNTVLPISTGTDGTVVLTGPDFMPGDANTIGGVEFGALYDESGPRKILDVNAALKVDFTVDEDMRVGDYYIIIDLFSFGLADRNDLTSTVNNAIYRAELEEDGDNSSEFTGTLEYIGLNQINIVEVETFEDIIAIGNEIVLISTDDSISVEYVDLDAQGNIETFTAEVVTPTHSGTVQFNQPGYKVADTVTITVEDADLNTDSGRSDIYTTFGDRIGSDVSDLLTVYIDGELWESCQDIDGLGDVQFTLRETSNDSGIFIGTFAIPEQHCKDGDARTVTGSDISVEYVDFRDDSGSVITVKDSASIQSNSGSISLDRTTYPVPFGPFDVTEDQHEDKSGFPLATEDALSKGDLTVYASITDSDFDKSPNGIDKIQLSGDAPVVIQVTRGSEVYKLGTAGDLANPISETEPDSGVFEHEFKISYNDGPMSDECPVSESGCILQGDTLTVEYSDPTDASGSLNTVTDSATFDLRNGLLQTDQTAYIIGSDAIIILIEQDLNLDSQATETYDLGLIEWDSDAGTCTLAGDDDCVNGSNPFDPNPSNLKETAPNSGIFQVVITIPQEIDDDKLERGEEITLEYADWGPAGSEFVGDRSEKISTTIYTSNFGASVELDQRVYTWTDKVYITVVAPDHNVDADQIDEIGDNDDYPVRISTRGYEIEEYKLVESGPSTGIFIGEVTLVGFGHDANGDGNDDKVDTRPSGTGPTDGMIPVESDSGISVSFKYTEGDTVSNSALVRWNVGDVQWLEDSYPASGNGIVRVIDPDMNLNPEAVDNFDVNVWSDSDVGGIDLTVTETGAANGIFEGTVFFGTNAVSDGHKLAVTEGDSVIAQYNDNTLPSPFKETERLRIADETLIGTIVPPLERVPISDLRIVDSFSNALDTITVNSQIQLAADLTNGQDKLQDFAYLVQIQNSNGVTVSLNWILGSLTAGQSLSPAVSWTPENSGSYEVTAFVWESLQQPSALSPTSTITIVVN